jgi:hypothetical protein
VRGLCRQWAAKSKLWKVNNARSEKSRSGLRLSLYVSYINTNLNIWTGTIWFINVTTRPMETLIFILKILWRDFLHLPIRSLEILYSWMHRPFLRRDQTTLLYEGKNRNLFLHFAQEVVFLLLLAINSSRDIFIVFKYWSIVQHSGWYKTFVSFYRIFLSFLCTKLKILYLINTGMPHIKAQNLICKKRV